MVKPIVKITAKKHSGEALMRAVAECQAISEILDKVRLCPMVVERVRGRDVETFPLKLSENDLGCLVVALEERRAGLVEEFSHDFQDLNTSGRT